MGRHGDRAREALLDAAEELFATHGIDSISNRRIAEHAGQSNHSAVTYHFGGREELIRATLQRHSEPIRRIRADLAEGLTDDASVDDYLRCLILPMTQHLAALPAPSRLARFLQYLRVTASASEIGFDIVGSDPLTKELVERMSTLLPPIPADVLRARQVVLGRMIVDVCADYEARIDAGGESPQWNALGYFLTDACAGMLSAPVTNPDIGVP
ncbi:TetR/AcrR family transcriptional regulator [Nocardia sp. NPDC055165]